MMGYANGTIARSPGGVCARWLAGAEVFVFHIWIWAYMWLILPLNNPFLSVVSVLGMIAFTVASHVARRTPLLAIGFRGSTFRPAMRLIAPGTAIAVAGLVAAHFILGLGEPVAVNYAKLPLKALAYFPWALLQQYATQGYALIRLREAAPRPSLAIFLAAALYTVFHYPNGLLMWTGMAACLFWCWAFHRRPNLYAVAISHAILGAVYGEFVAPAYWADMAVGPKLFLH